MEYKEDEPLITKLLICITILLILALVRQDLIIREKHRAYRSLLDVNVESNLKNIQAEDYITALEQAYDALWEKHEELIKFNQEVSESRALWENLAATDAMTGIANHRAFQAKLREEIARAQRYDYSLILLMLDVDRFKPYNDAFGHPAGDQVLREIAGLLRDTVREGDFVARYGGEEFAALLPQTDLESGRRVAERIRAVVEAHSFAHRPITLSIGAAEFFRNGNSEEELLSSADRALYAAKNQGRNQVVFFSDGETA